MLRVDACVKYIDGDAVSCVGVGVFVVKGCGALVDAVKSPCWAVAVGVGEGLGGEAEGGEDDCGECF